MKVRDKLWMFGVRPHQDDERVAALHEDGTYLRKSSRITPAEGAAMLDIPNVIMVCCENEPAPFTDDAYCYAESFINMKNVMWSASSTGGRYHSGEEEDYICALARDYPNITGAFLDDLLVSFREQEDPSKLAAELLKKVRAGLAGAPRPLDIYMVWYTYETENTSPEVIDLVDGITLWTWDSNELPLLEKRFERIEQQFPDKKKMLGVYLYDFPNHRAVPIDLMELQCELALKLLKERRIEGIIIETNAVMGLGLSSELWLREWLKKVKNIEI